MRVSREFVTLHFLILFSLDFHEREESCGMYCVDGYEDPSYDRDLYEIEDIEDNFCQHEWNRIWRLFK